MSESLPIAENPSKPAKDSSDSTKEKPQNQRAVIATALMTAISTIAVSFIGIVPQLRRTDAATIQELKQDVNQLKQKSLLTLENKPTPGTSDRKMNISGRIKSEDGKRTLNGVEVYLLPEDNYRLTTKTDDSGVFNFQGIPAGQYSIIIRDSSGGKSGKGLLDESGEEVRVMGGVIKYRIR